MYDELSHDPSGFWVRLRNRSDRSTAFSVAGVPR